MIRVSMMLYPFGRARGMKELCAIEIINDGTGTSARGNYHVLLYDRRGGLCRRARLENYPRTKPAWRILEAAMKRLDAAYVVRGDEHEA